MKWYLENQATEGEAPSRELIEYIEQNGIRMDMKLDPQRLGRILADSKQFTGTYKYSPRYKCIMTIWQVKPK